MKLGQHGLGGDEEGRVEAKRVFWDGRSAARGQDCGQAGGEQEVGLGLVVMLDPSLCSWTVGSSLWR